MLFENQIGDTIYTFRLIKLLARDWEDFEAYKLGIIDDKGKRIKSVKLDTTKKREAYTPFIRIAINLKRILQRVTGVNNRLNSVAAALFLIKEKFKLSDKSLNKILKEQGLDPLDLLVENSEWFIVDELIIHYRWVNGIHYRRVNGSL